MMANKTSGMRPLCSGYWHNFSSFFDSLFQDCFLDCVLVSLTGSHWLPYFARRNLPASPSQHRRRTLFRLLFEDSIFYNPFLFQKLYFSNPGCP